MELILKRATCEDAELIWKMQIEAFSDLYEKYQDTDTSPQLNHLKKFYLASGNALPIIT